MADWGASSVFNAREVKDRLLIVATVAALITSEGDAGKYPNGHSGDIHPDSQGLTHASLHLSRIQAAMGDARSEFCEFSPLIVQRVVNRGDVLAGGPWLVWLLTPPEANMAQSSENPYCMSS
jgi:hypothetical protein